MIELVGIEGSREHVAARALYDAFLAAWPDVASTPRDEEHVKVVAGVKLANANRTDVDVVVAGYLKPGRVFHPRKVLRDKEGKRIVGQAIAVQNLVVAVEVKDQGPKAVRFIGDKVEVYYSRGASKGWHSATDQNVEQAHALKDYFADRGGRPYVHRCLVMQGLDSVEVETAIASGFTLADFLTAVCAASPLGAWNGKYTLSSCSQDIARGAVASRLFEPLVPTSLDRKRMDRLLQKGGRVDQLLASNGQAFTCLRGHGGTGKTVTCLQAAWRAFHDHAERTLVITYNHALAADIRRILALMGVPSGDEGGIKVQTAMSFFFGWLNRLGVTEPGQDSLEQYDELCRAAVALIDGGAIGADDILKIKQDWPAQFDFDRVMIDEAQDSPAGEVALLKRLYAPESIVISDGLDQLVRGERADWFAGITRDKRLVLSEVRCLRMKRNLAVFGAELADCVGLNLDIAPNDKAGGGRVIVVEGAWSAQRALHDELARDAADANNEPIDSLFCVPSDAVSWKGGHAQSDIARALDSWGYEAWDGVDESVRQDFPRSTNQFRVVNYHSCRGLEGWNVVLERLDAFWEERRNDKLERGLSDAERDSMQSLEDLASREAWRWVFIALTRPLDTLVITLGDLSSPLSREIVRVAEALPDIVDNRLRRVIG